MPNRLVFVALCLSACASNQSPPSNTKDAANLSLEPARRRLTSDNLSITVEPSDEAQALISAISAATTSVHMTMYLMTDQGVEGALAERAKAGLDVKVILDHHSPGGADTFNKGSFAYFQANGVNVQWAPDAFTFTHEKCAVIDNTSAWIMTMNTSYSAPRDNREFLALDSDAADIAEAEAIFEADWANETYVPSGALVVSPDNSHDKLVALLDCATATLDVEDEELSSTDVVTALCDAAALGVQTRVVLAADATPAIGQQQAVKALQACGVTVVSVSVPYIHAKAIIVDATLAYVGSINLTTTSMSYNRELGLITQNAAAVSTIAATVAADIAAGTTVVVPPSCSTANDCPNLTDGCYSGLCVPTCVGNQFPDGYVCVQTAPTAVGSCQLPAACSASADCSAGLVCLNAACAFCTVTSDCAAGLVCQTNGLCAAPPVTP